MMATLSISPLPLELIHKILLFLKDPFTGADGKENNQPYYHETLRALRLTCRQLSSFVAPMLFRRIKVILHLYFLERLAEDVNKGTSLREHVHKMVLDIHPTVSAATMFLHAYKAHGIINGLVEARYVQPSRREHDRQLETEALLTVLHSLDKVRSVVLVLCEINQPSRVDPCPASCAMDKLQERLQIPKRIECINLDRQNWHYENPSVLVSILHALNQYPQLTQLAFRQFNLARLRCGPPEIDQSIVQMVHKVISKTDCVSFKLNVEEYDEYYGERDNNFVALYEVWTEGPSSLLRHAEECITLEVSFTRPVGDMMSLMVDYEESFYAIDFMRLRASRPWPVMSKLKALHLGNLFCMPQDLLTILTVHYPQLQECALHNIVIPEDPTAQERHELWTEFLKQLKARANLKLLRFCGLINSHDLSGTRAVFPSHGMADAALELYTKTIVWFHDQSSSDEECPLNDYGEAYGLSMYYCTQYYAKHTWDCYRTGRL